jgi:hypothetical protein
MKTDRSYVTNPTQKPKFFFFAYLTNGYNHNSTTSNVFHAPSFLLPPFFFPLYSPISFHVFKPNEQKETKTAQRTSHHLISLHYIGLIVWETTYLPTLQLWASSSKSYVSSWLAFCMQQTMYVCMYVPLCNFSSLEKSSTCDLKHAFDGKPNWDLRLSYLPT